jgi:adenosylmethionine-8-amino-7-oxononanoate aminotransferase
VQAAAGMITAPEGYLRRVREATQAHNVLLIADEVAVGCGRTGTMFACSRDQEGIVPDFLCVAKGLTGGYLPLAATLTTEEVFRAFLGRPEEGKTFYHGHTFTGNPLGAAVALASLDRLEQVVLPSMPEKVERLRGHLDRLARLPCVGEVRQRGLMAGIELVRDRQTKERFPAAARMGARVCRLAREQGVLLRPLGDVVVVMPPLAIEASLLDRIGEVLYNSLVAIPCE